MNLEALQDLLHETYLEWREDKVSRLAAALSYYTMFSLVPLLVIVIAIAGRVFGEDVVEGQIVQQLQAVVGENGARAVETLVISVRAIHLGPITTIIAAALLVFGASHLFFHLKDVLNTIWQVEQKPEERAKLAMRDRLLAFITIFALLRGGLAA